jgi:Domain of unknown function (DUF6268)
MHIFNNIILAILIVLIYTNYLYANEETNLFIAQTAHFVRQSDVNDQNGEFSTAEYSLSAEKEYSISDRLPITTAFNINHIEIKNSTAVDLPSSLQTKSIYNRFYIPAPLVDNEKFFIGIDLVPGFNTASEHDFSSKAFRFNIGTSVIYRQENDLIIVAGVMFRQGYDNSVVPFAGFKYKVNSRLDLNFISLNPNIAYKLNDKSKILLEMNILADEFEIVKGNRNGQRLNVYGLDAGIGYKYNINENFSSKLGMGIAFARKFEYIENGDKIEPKDAMYIDYALMIRY